jgi:hypothetical protein
MWEGDYDILLVRRAVGASRQKYKEEDQRNNMGRGGDDMQRERSLHSKYGGVHFVQLKHAREINEFVRNLPADKKDSLFEVMQELHNHGYIQIANDGEWMDPGAEIHPIH